MNSRPPPLGTKGPSRSSQKKTVPEKEEPLLFVLKFFISELRLPVSSDLLHPDLPDLKIELVPDNPLLF